MTMSSISSSGVLAAGGKSRSVLPLSQPDLGAVLLMFFIAADANPYSAYFEGADWMFEIFSCRYIPYLLFHNCYPDFSLPAQIVLCSVHFWNL